MVDSALSLSTPTLPSQFPTGTTAPRFQLGDRVGWHPLPSQDFGTITGVEFTPANHLPAWGWRYVIWLDTRSPSALWTASDTAWEEDLELLDKADPEHEEPNHDAST